MRVLVVEDHPSMRSILKKMLHRMQCFESIEEAADGEEGWHKLQTQIFHLIIADINMPRLNGIELLKRCRGEVDFRNTPYLIVSGESLQDVIAFVGEWGVVDYVVKPFSYSILKSRIEAMFERLRNPEELLYREVEKLKGMSYYREALQRVEEAEANLKDFNVKWLTIKGECLMALGNMKRAEECLNRALRLSDVYLPAHKSSAELNLKQGNVDRAIELLARADEISPMDTDRKLNLGKLLLGQGREDEGRVFLEKAVKQSSHGERGSILRRVAEAFMESNHFAEAEELFVKLLKLSPDQVETYNRLGIALRRQGKYEEAEACYRMALENHPKNPVIHYNLGVLQYSRQEKENARQSLLEAIRLDPGFTRAREILRQVEASL
jgi:tetratricopeptide (TPR) repeat protein